MFFDGVNGAFEDIDKVRDYLRREGTSLAYDVLSIAEETLKKEFNKKGWIPVTEKLPDKPYGCLVTVMDTNPITFDEFENIYPNFVGWDGENWNDDDGHSIPFEVIAWMPLPMPYKGVEE